MPGFAIDRSNVDAVTRVCQRLEGIPLALELAAVRLRVLPITDLAARLEDRFALLVEGGRTAPARHRTLRATVDWSYELCTQAEQLLWARCAIFAGSFDLSAAEAVCSDERRSRPGPSWTPSPSLVDKSILTAEQGGGSARFRILETIREYGLARLEEDGLAHDFRARHRDWYLRLIGSACTEWFGPQQRSWCDRLRVEQPNLRAAIDFSSRTRTRPRPACELVGRPLVPLGVPVPGRGPALVGPGLGLDRRVLGEPAAGLGHRGLHRVAAGRPRGRRAICSRRAREGQELNPDAQTVCVHAPHPRGVLPVLRRRRTAGRR